jgi:hypothetical protein
MNQFTKTEEFLALVNGMLREKLPSLEKSNLEELQIKVSIYHIFEKHNDTEQLYYELLDYLEDEGLEVFIGDVENSYKLLNK